MPFHNQEEEEKGKGREWSWSLDTYLAIGKPIESLNCHPSLEMRARFTSLIFLMPSPPKAFEVQMESHAFRERFLVFLEGKPHRKFLNDLSNSLQQLFGIKNVPIA